MKNCSNICTPPSVAKSTLVGRSLDVHLRARRAKKYLKWGAINIVVLAILMFDINNKCPYADSNWYHAEYLAAVVFAVSIIVCFVKYFLFIFDTNTLNGTKVQKDLLSFNENDNSFVVRQAEPQPERKKTLYENIADKSMNATILSWYSSFKKSRRSHDPKNRSFNRTSPPRHSLSPQRDQSFNDTHSPYGMNWNFNRTTPPRLSPQRDHPYQDSRPAYGTTWNFNQQTPPPRQSLSPQRGQPYPIHNETITSSFAERTRMLLNESNLSNLSSNTSNVSPYRRYRRDCKIRDEQSLREFLSEVARTSRLSNPIESSRNANANALLSFWGTCNNAVRLLKTSIYQLAPITTPTGSTPTKQSGNEEGTINSIDRNCEVIKLISSEKLSLYVTNLRMWIASTILHRLVKEIEHIDQSFISRGFMDMQIGHVGLDRLRKTAENHQFVNQYMPKLPLILPFLEIYSNQEYLVQRIKDLANGSCIADYCWNSGSTYHGIKWNDHLPTDSALLFHLFCVYFDSQLMPLPQGGGRPFFSRYVIIGEENISAKDTISSIHNKASCAILCTNPLKPKLNFISDNEIHNCAYDRNNFFYVIIQFLIYMRTHQHSCLEGVNLGKGGINIMCVLE